MQVVSFFLNEWRQLVDSIQQLKDADADNLYIRGAKCLLQLTRLRCERRIVRLTSAFSKHAEIPEVPAEDFLINVTQSSQDDQADELPNTCEHERWEGLGILAQSYSTDESDGDEDRFESRLCS